MLLFSLSVLRFFGDILRKLEFRSMILPEAILPSNLFSMSSWRLASCKRLSRRIRTRDCQPCAHDSMANKYHWKPSFTQTSYFIISTNKTSLGIKHFRALRARCSEFMHEIADEKGLRHDSFGLSGLKWWPLTRSLITSPVRLSKARNSVGKSRKIINPGYDLHSHLGNMKTKNDMPHPDIHITHCLSIWSSHHPSFGFWI